MIQAQYLPNFCLSPSQKLAPLAEAKQDFYHFHLSLQHSKSSFIKETVVTLSQKVVQHHG